MKMEMLQTSDAGHIARAVVYLEAEGYRTATRSEGPGLLVVAIEISDEEQDTGRMLSEHVRFDPVISGKQVKPSARVYNEVYCYREHTVAVETEIRALMAKHPEWGLDIAVGAGNWEDVED